MKILVAVKRVVDYQVAIRLKQDGSQVETANVKMSMNPFDEIAVEEAVRIKEQGKAQEIVVVSIGNDACQETLRSALALGADRAILVKTDTEIEALDIAKILKKIATDEQVQLIILGKQAIDNDDNQVAQMLAGLLNYAQGTFASKLEFVANGLQVTREIDGGLETLLLTLPAVISTDLRLNEPRYLSLPNIVQAKRKPINVVSANELGLNLQAHYRTIKVEMPEKKRAAKRLDNAKELVTRLKEEQVI